MEADGVIRTTSSRIDKFIKIVVLLLLLNLLGFGVFYYVDQHSRSGASLVEMQIQQLGDAVRSDPNNASTRVQVAAGYAALGRHTDAIDQYNQALKLEPENQPALFGLASTFMALHQYDQALPLLQKVADLNNSNPYRKTLKALNSVYYSIAFIEMQKGEADAAIASLKDALDVDSSDADSYRLLGDAYKHNGNLDDAISAYQQAVRFDLNYTEAYEGLAAVYDRKGQVGEATYARGMSDYSRRNYEEAAKYLSQAAGELPDNADVRAGLGLTYERLGQAEQAVQSYKDAVNLNPDQSIARPGLKRLESAQ